MNKINQIVTPSYNHISKTKTTLRNLKTANSSNRADQDCEFCFFLDSDHIIKECIMTIYICIFLFSKLKMLLDIISTSDFGLNLQKLKLVIDIGLNRNTAFNVQE